MLKINSYSNNDYKYTAISAVIKPLFLSISLLLTISDVYGLSGTTAKVINGTEPYLLLPDGVTEVTKDNIDTLLDDWFTIYIPDPTDKNQRIKLTRDLADKGIYELAKNTKLSEIQAIVEADNQPHTVTTDFKVGDVDGDADNPVNTSVSAEIQACWINELNPLGCEKFLQYQTVDDCTGPYNLTLKFGTPFAARTKYGIPNSRAYGVNDYSVTYKFLVDNKRICWLQPFSMDYFHSDNVGEEITIREGYYRRFWDWRGKINPDEDHSVGEYMTKQRGWLRKYDGVYGDKFPTTGFKGARFSILASGYDQSIYRCSSEDDGIKIKLSNDIPRTFRNELLRLKYDAVGQNCTVTYLSRTKAQFMAGGKAPSIRIEQKKPDGEWWQVDRLYLEAPQKWALGSAQVLEYGDNNNLMYAKNFPALDICRGVSSGTTTRDQAVGQSESDKQFRQKFMYRRDEITNSPYSDRNKAPEFSSVTLPEDSYFVRDVDHTFMGEWGRLEVYPDSPWFYSDNYHEGLYLTPELWSPERGYSVGGSGNVLYYNKGILVCRGD
ncbi:hypothetical protein A9G11_06975 [Gilliamella sp. wkB108]|uniref:hypothetical protein n=1 Tax=Gilliamella sp. wkB108 TaxID=3120256 RepID=UPI00080E50AB|nr:hypothetical protein [Gilliamella apicola]OCG22638.1 hypothetical protein A9G11_06975 [Gilliamella apicola]